MRNPESSGKLPALPFAFLLPPDLFGGGCFNDFDLWLPAETAVEDDQEDYNYCYLKNMIYEHAITPCSDIIQESCRKVKVNGMKILKKILCFLLCVVILSGTVGTKYLDSNHMETVEAAGAVVVVGGITLATMFEICLFVGATALAVYGIGEAYQNREEIARFGKEFIDSCSDKAEGWVMQFVDAAGQDYVLGKEALDEIQKTAWDTILAAAILANQGGSSGEDPNKKDDKDKFHIPGDPLTHVAQFTALGATWFTANAKQIYQDWCDILNGWVGKDTPIPQNNVLFNNFPGTFSEFVQNTDGTYTISCYAQALPDQFNTYNTWQLNCAVNNRVCLVRSNVDGYCYDSYSLDTLGKTVILNYTKGYISPSGSRYWNTPSLSGNLPISISINIPIFSSYDAYEEAFVSGDYSGAVNYSKEYRIADWLQQDWAGQLIDPLVNIGLTLSQLIDVMRALGLNTLQGLNAQQLLDLLKNVLPKLDPALLPDAVPTPIVVDPAVDPIYYPDPDAHPDKPPRPVIDPDPGKKPNPKPDPDPGTDPDPNPDPDPDPVPLPDMDAADYKVELTGIFPFCIPFDFVALLKTLDAEPRAPCFTFPVVIPALDYREDVKLDLAIFDDVAKVIRLCEKVSFILFLMFVTSKVIRW